MAATMIGSSCEAARGLAALAPDGELAATEARLLQEHLRRCQACALFAAEVAAITSMLRGERWPAVGTVPVRASVVRCCP